MYFKVLNKYDYVMSEGKMIPKEKWSRLAKYVEENAKEDVEYNEFSAKAYHGITFTDAENVIPTLYLGDKLLLVKPHYNSGFNCIDDDCIAEDEDFLWNNGCQNDGLCEHYTGTFISKTIEIIEVLDIWTIPTFERLKNMGIDILDFDSTVLTAAAEKGHLDIVIYLVDKGADIHGLSEDALSAAAKNGHLEICKYLVEIGADINHHVMMAAIEYQQNKIIDYFLDVLEETDPRYVEMINLR